MVLVAVTYNIIACNVTHAFSQCKLMQMKITATLITFQTPLIYLYLVKTARILENYQNLS
jgi:hypothetical protein